MNIANTAHLDPDHKVLTVVLQNDQKDDPVYIEKGISGWEFNI